MHSFAIGMTVAATVIAACYANRLCQRRPHDIEAGRKCRKNCTYNSDCVARNKQCQCDGACGMSYFNPNALCKDLPSITNGTFSITSRNIGGNVSYSCNAGYRIQGSRTSICRADKKWYPDPPTCEIAQCGNPPAIQNGFLNASSTGIGAEVTYNCNTGFGIRGSIRLICRADGNWYPNVPTCEDFADCGRSWPGERFGRVVGGSDSDKNAWPWQVLIARSSSSMLKSLERDNLHGGGSILNQKWVLSAAHVFGDAKTKSVWPRNIIMFAGITKRPSSGAPVEESIVAYSIKKYHEHEEYTEKTLINDIALIEVGYKLDQNLQPEIPGIAGFTFGYSIKPVCLPCKGTCSTKPLHSEGTKATVTGFGHIIRRSRREPLNFTPPETLQQASIQIASNITCREHIEEIKRENRNYAALEFTESMLCSKPAERDACKGDSGGPLVRKVEDENTEETRWVQVGIVSFGYGCAWNHPGYYTKVASFIPWINERMKANPDCDFDDSTNPTCNYKNEGLLWRRKQVELANYVIEGGIRRSKLISVVIPQDWTVENATCLKFRYRIMTPYGYFKVSSAGRHNHPDISWYRSGHGSVWHDAKLDIRNDREIQFQFEVIIPTVQLDDIALSKAPCDVSSSCEAPGKVGQTYPIWTIGRSFSIGDRVRYRCPVGYLLNGDAYRTCQRSGWSSFSSYCFLQRCGILGDVYNGVINYTNEQYQGSYATLSCKQGYKPESLSSARIRCNATEKNGRYGGWSGQLPRCRSSR